MNATIEELKAKTQKPAEKPSEKPQQPAEQPQQPAEQPSDGGGAPAGEPEIGHVMGENESGVNDAVYGGVIDYSGF